jgi:hypothetical protein
VETSAAQHQATTLHNWRLLGLALALTLAGGVLAFRGGSPSTALAGAALALVGVKIIIQELPGVRVGPDNLSFPARPLGSLPLLAFGRRTAPLADVVELLVARRWLLLERVRLETTMGDHLLVFDSRSARKRFTDVLKTRCGVKIYRYER